MALLVPFGVAVGGLVIWGFSHDVRRWVRSWLDDLDRARHVRECEEADRERKLALDAAGLQEDDLLGAELDETDERFLVYQRNRIGDAFDWTCGEVEDALVSIQSLTCFYPAHWERRRAA